MTLSSATTPSTPWRYSRTAVFLHWALALLIVLTTALGWRMMAIEDDPGSEQFFDLHKSIGLIIATLLSIRCVWRLMHRREPLPAGLPAWETRLAGITHGLLYLLIIVMPVTGYLGASYSRAGVKWFGLATPRWAAPDRDLAELFFTVHGVLVWVLVVVVVLHVIGALKHLLVDKDGVFQRMWIAPRRR